MIRNIWAVGRNYGAHAKELGNAIPQSPMIFLKAGSSALESGETLTLPSWSNDVHHEVELALVFDTALQVREALVTVDLTARDEQNRAKKEGLPWTRAKSFKQSCLLGSRFKVNNLEELTPLSLELKLNGVTRQSGQVSDMIFSPKQLVDYLLESFPVCPGDLLLTGTPAGVGPLKAGDKIEISIPERSYGQWSCK